MTPEKLQKVLARAGLGSRRTMETWIADGRVTVNGEPAQLGMRVTEKDRLVVDGRPVKQVSLEEKHAQVLLYHKPIGEVCTRQDEKGRKTVFDALPRLKSGRWVSVGRLDINTSGLLLFTTDGNLANQLMHPSNQIEREYAVRVCGVLTDEQAHQMANGVTLEDGVARVEHIVGGEGDHKNHWYHLVVMEGRNRLVRRLFEHFHLTISRLTRVRLGPVFLPKTVSRGKWVYLTEAEVAALRESAAPEKA